MCFFFSGKALESQSEFRRAHWKDMFTGRMKTEIPPALINLTRLDFSAPPFSEGLMKDEK